MTDIDEKRKKDNFDLCDGITIFECLYICKECSPLLQKIKEDIEKKAEGKENSAIEVKREVEMLINESGDLGKWPEGDY